MIQLLRALAAFPEDPSYVPTIHLVTCMTPTSPLTSEVTSMHICTYMPAGKTLINICKHLILTHTVPKTQHTSKAKNVLIINKHKIKPVSYSQGK